VTPRARVASLAAAAAAGLVALATWQARVEARSAWRRALVAQAEETGAFARRALASGHDLLVAERLADLARRPEVAWVLILDRTGRATFHGRPEDVGKIYESAWAKVALAATATLIQEIPDSGATEADVPVGGGAVLRLGFTFGPLGAAERWLALAAGVAAAGFAALGLLAARGG
jgi:hypothetical protein